MSETVILRKTPKIEFKLLDSGFEIIDRQTERNTGFYSYKDLQSIDLNNAWFPRLAKWLRVITWIFNGVPYFPDAETYKKANLIIHFRKTRFGVWLTDPYMADKAKKIKELLDEKTRRINSYS